MAEMAREYPASDLEAPLAPDQNGRVNEGGYPTHARANAMHETAAIDAVALQDLFHHAIEGNPYTHSAAIDAQRPLSRAETKQCLLAKDRSAATGFIAFHEHRLLRTARALVSPYAPVSVPPVRAGKPAETIAEMLDALASDGFETFRISTPTEGLFFDALSDAVTARNASTETLRAWSRAGLFFGEADPDNPTGLSSKKRKEMRRLKRRLEDHGSVELKPYEGDTLREGAQRFLKLEETGWKGAAGTAMTLSPVGKNLFDAFVFGCPPAIKCVIHSLEVNGEPVSMFVTFIQNGQAYLWKTSFDPAFAQHSPSGLLLLDMIPLLQAQGVWMIDSCSSNATSMADIYLPHRIKMADMLISTAKDRQRCHWFKAAAFYYATHETLRAKAKHHLAPLLKRR